jgi:hypothetical protein
MPKVKQGERGGKRRKMEDGRWKMEEKAKGWGGVLLRVS